MCRYLSTVEYVKIFVLNKIERTSDYMNTILGTEFKPF